MEAKVGFEEFREKTEYLEDIALEIAKDLMRKLNNHQNINLFVSNGKMFAQLKVGDDRTATIDYNLLTGTLLDMVKVISMRIASDYVEYNRKMSEEDGDNGIIN